MSSANDLAERLEGYRAYLELLARLQSGRALKGKVDLSGVVQQTLWEGLQRLRLRPGLREDEVAAMLRQVLASNLIDAARKVRAGKRDVRRETSLDEELQASSGRIEAFLAASDTGASKRLDRQEQLLRLAEALATLPDGQRKAVELHYLQGLPLAAVSQEMGRSKPSVAGLLQRGLAALRGRLQEPQEKDG
jgi:RNA polymerase sigma-70 factor (ECF subfamily)